MGGGSEKRITATDNGSLGSLALFDEAKEAINESLLRLKPWQGFQIDEYLTIGGILSGLRKTLVSIQERSLSGSLEEWMTGFREKHESMGVKVSFHELGVKKTLSDRVRNELIYVFQEACGNAVQHGEADVIQILFLYQIDSFKVTISDDGSGIECLEKLGGKREGSGLDSIKARIEKLGGEVEFSNKPGGEAEGFVIVTTLPSVCSDAQQESNQDSVLGHELHDYLCPEMIGVVMILASIRRKLTEDESEMWYELQCAEEKLSDCSAKFRTLSHQLIE